MCRWPVMAMTLALLGARLPAAPADGGGATAPATSGVAAEAGSPAMAETAAGGGRAPGAEGSGAVSRALWQRVYVAPTRTSIYIGTVSMSMPVFVRAGQTFSAPYAAKVFPYFFYNEKGVLNVDVTDAQLDALAAGQPIDFTGTAVRSNGETRKVTAKATPKDATSGKLDVHVFVSKRIQLIFHTTYRVADRP